MNLFKKISQQFSPKKEFPLILITGAPKTGTTAVYHSIREQLPADSTCLFEPENRSLQLPEIISSPVLVKSFVPISEKYDFFNKKILITRDPRDYIISRILYSTYDIIMSETQETTIRTHAYLNKFLRLLENKEANPGSVSFRTIYDLFKPFIMKEYLELVIKYYEERPSIFLFKYEDYVDGKLNLLNDFLGLKTSVVQDVPEKRVIRSKSYGNWKDWFTLDDIEFFKGKFHHYMNIFGYHDDWEINHDPNIDPKISSIYVRKLIDEAKRELYLQVNKK